MENWETPRGFTLVETLIVLSLVCVAVSRVIPSFESVSMTTKMTRLATELNGFVVMAKSLAVMRRQPLWIHLSIVNGSWELELTDSEKEYQGEVLMRLSGSSFSGIEIETTYSSNQISFDATHGRPKSGRFIFFLASVRRWLSNLEHIFVPQLCEFVLQAQPILATRHAEC
nr:GspH/FimT family pseudopilin [Vibrio neptunius]